VRIETPRQLDLMSLLSALDAYLSSLYPPQSNHILDIDALCAPNVRFFVARRAAEAVRAVWRLLARSAQPVL
jgi:putative acetyltransferase